MHFDWPLLVSNFCLMKQLKNKLQISIADIYWKYLEKNMLFTTADHLAWVKSHTEVFIASMTRISPCVRAQFKHEPASLFYLHYRSIQMPIHFNSSSPPFLPLEWFLTFRNVYLHSAPFYTSLMVSVMVKQSSENLGKIPFNLKQQKTFFEK